MSSPLSPHAEHASMIRPRSAVDRAGAAIRAASGNRRLADLGLLDVTAEPYNADSTGSRDSTRALQRAINDARDARMLTYLPPGSYLVSDTLVGIQGTVTHEHWPYGPADARLEYDSYFFPCTLIGARTGGRARLRLSPDARGFDDPSQPKPVIHFWARQETRPGPGQESNPREEQLNISFNQQIIDVDIDVSGHAGAIAIDHQGAQSSVIEDVSIDASGAFAGLRGLNGSGGGTHGVTIIGGRFGILARRTTGSHRGSQPAPVVSASRLEGQTEAALLYDGRGPLTLAGCELQGAGIVVDAPTDCTFNGPLNLVDSVLRITNGQPAIRSSHPVVISNTFISGTTTVVEHNSQILLHADPASWTRIDTWATPAAGIIVEDGKPATIERVERNLAAPDRGPLTSHSRPKPLPDWTAVANVKEPRYGAIGDGKTDDTDAIQRAIDENTDVFLPKGDYALSRPLRLHAQTRLFGLGPVQTTLLALEDAPAFRDILSPAPLLETVDDAAATTELAFVALRLPVDLAGAYAMRWRAGRHSVVRNITVDRSLWHPNEPGLFHPLVRIEGNGGGTWFHFHASGWWSQSPHYRHLLVDETHEPLRFYMLNPEHARCEAQVEFRRASDVRIYSCKGEGNYPVLWFNDCRDVQLFGYGGNGHAWPGWSLIKIDDGHDLTFTQLAPQVAPYRPGRWTALGVKVGLEGWSVLRDGAWESRPTEHLTYFRRSKRDGGR